MRLSDERITFLGNHIVKTLVREKMINAENETARAQEVKILIIHFLKNEEMVDAKIREKIASIKRGVPEYSREWDILYEQYYNEEMGRMKRV